MVILHRHEGSYMVYKPKIMLSKHKYRRICIAYGIKNHEILIIDIRMVFKKERQYQSNTTSHMGDLWILF